MDQDGDVIDILVQPRRDQRAAERFFRRLLRGQGKEPFRIITDKLRSYSAALRAILCDVAHDTKPFANNRAEVSHQPTRQRDFSITRVWELLRKTIHNPPLSTPASGQGRENHGPHRLNADGPE